ncbi:MAG: hypothetical protein ACPGOY_10335 [Rhodospirillaceae bacterium]
MNWAALLSGFAGALVATFLLRALLLWLMKKWNGGILKYLLANGISYGITGLLSSYGFADGGPPDFVKGFATYALPQLVWLAFDLVRYWRGTKVGAESPT